MNHIVYKHIACLALPLLMTFSLQELFAGTPTGNYDYSHRMRDCEITLFTPAGEPLPTTLVGVRLIRNDFAFGGSIRSEGFDSLGDDYGDMFLSYFDVATPENEMKWGKVMKCSQKCDPDFSKADSLVAWLQIKDILIHGYSLFSNEKEDQIPEWTRNLEPAAFKQAMQERINTAMDHFKGKVQIWDLISEICHGENGSFLSSSMLETKSGDPNILSWIMDEARKKDSTAKFIIDDYGTITTGDQIAVDQFINKVKPLSSKFQIIGAEGTFGSNMNKSIYEPKINYLVQQIGKPIWLTNVDFSVDINLAPDKLEELMRACFANPKVRGLTIRRWFRNYIPHDNLTSYFVDSMNNETSVGKRWRDVRDEWKTYTTGYTDESGKFKFNGYQGTYQVIISCYLDTFYLEPGEGTKLVKVTHQGEAAADRAMASLKTIEIIINGRSVPVKLPSFYDKQVFLTTYSFSGQLLSRSTINLKNGKYKVTLPFSYTRVFRIEAADRQPLYTGKIMRVR
jgi:GH35 family endo-1,4-beta-xylanase